MQDGRFDRWTKALSSSRSRRGVLAGLAGAIVALTSQRRTLAQISTPGGMCGGLGGFPCPDGFECVDDPGDSCDPTTSGADCSGICVPIDANPCAAILCIEGTTCCPQCGGICLPHDIPCSEVLCVSEPCNQVMCGPGEYCCNESCSICAPLGGGCIALFCEPPGQVGVPCGPTICAPGEVCCNESCGICTPPDGVCIALACID
jgi:hypothetical protein